MLLLVHFLTPDGTVSPSQHMWYIQQGQIPKAVAILIPKNHAVSIILIEVEDLPI